MDPSEWNSKQSFNEHLKNGWNLIMYSHTLYIEITLCLDERLPECVVCCWWSWEQLALAYKNLHHNLNKQANNKLKILKFTLQYLKFLGIQVTKMWGK